MKAIKVERCVICPNMELINWEENQGADRECYCTLLKRTIGKRNLADLVKSLPDCPLPDWPEVDTKQLKEWAGSIRLEEGDPIEYLKDFCRDVGVIVREEEKDESSGI